jgi:hypothetical protein
VTVYRKYKKNGPKSGNLKIAIQGGVEKAGVLYIFG